ncbi:glycosyltransferase family 87 protein [Spirobacillus cienkowskii]|uniref:glycosyltransferase family 87 protein n=1 Tax=Spirobacillus cienkowskii TaxID=495820 RepID=UPI0030D3BB44
MKKDTFSKFNIKKMLLIYILVILIISLIKIFVSDNSANNYYIFLNSLKHILLQQNLYVHYNIEYFDLYKYSPLFPLIMFPFLLFNLKIGAILWNLFNALMLFKSITMFKISERKKVIVLAIILPEIINNANNFQSNALLAALFVMCYHLLEKNKLFLFSAASSFLLVFKIYGFFVAYNLIFKNVKTIFKFLLYTSFSLILLSLCIISISSYDYFISQFLSYFHLLKIETSSYGMSLIAVSNNFLNLNIHSMYYQVFGLILFSILIFKKIYLSNFKNNLLEHEKIDLLILGLIFIVIFNQKTESPTIIIGALGVSIYLAYYKEYQIFKSWVFWLKMLVTSLSSTDIVPKIIKINYLEPYNVKVIPLIIFFFYFYCVVLNKNYKQIECYNNFKKIKAA